MNLLAKNRNMYGHNCFKDHKDISPCSSIYINYSKRYGMGCLKVPFLPIQMDFSPSMDK